MQKVGSATNLCLHSRPLAGVLGCFPVIFATDLQHESFLKLQKSLKPKADGGI